MRTIAFKRRAGCLGLALVLLLQADWLLAQPQPGTQLWAHDFGEHITACPALSPDGATIYIGTAASFYAISHDGSKKWTFPIAQTYYTCTPAVGSDGTIYTGDDAANFYAINPDGTQKWKLPLQPEFQYKIVYASSPAIGVDDRVYMLAGGRLYAVTPSGTILWEFPVDDASGPAHSIAPAIGSDGTIYVGSTFNRTFYAVNPDGTEKWKLPTYQECGDSAAVARDGTIYFTGSVLFSVSTNGTLNWVSLADQFEAASPAIASDGTVYVSSSSDLSLYAFTPSGDVKWHAVPDGMSTNFVTVPAIDANGMIYYCVSNSVFALTPGGNVQWTFISSEASHNPPLGNSNISPAIGPDGTIYAAFGSTLYAIKGTNGLGSTPWPMYRQNLRHTGKVEKPSLTPPKRRVDANFDLQLSGEMGQPYTVESTTNFLDWTFVTSFVATNLPMSVTDLTASNAPARFYRASTP